LGLWGSQHLRPSGFGAIRWPLARPSHPSAEPLREDPQSPNTPLQSSTGPATRRDRSSPRSFTAKPRDTFRTSLSYAVALDPLSSQEALAVLDSAALQQFSASQGWAVGGGLVVPREAAPQSASKGRVSGPLGCTAARRAKVLGTTRPPPTALRSGRQVLLPRRRNRRTRHLDEDIGPRRLRRAPRMHVDLARQPVALAAVAGRAGGDDVLPD